MISKPYLLKMRKLISILFVSALWFFTSCNSDTFQEHEIGDNLIDKSTEVHLIDTFTVRSATVKLDSLLTSGYSNVLFGGYHDEFFGEVSSEFYTTLGLGGAFEMGADANGKKNVKLQFDSLVFIGFPDTRYYGDTLQEQTISFHKLKEEIDLPNGQIGFYGHHTIAHDEVAFGSASFYLKPRKQSVEIKTIGDKTIPEIERERDGLRLRIDDAFGWDIINRVNADDDTLQNIFKWRNFFNGMVLKPGSENSALFSFKLGAPGMNLRLYFTYEGGDRGYHDFPVILAAPRQGENGLAYYNFSNFVSDKSSTPQDLGRIVEETEELKSEETDDLAFIQGGIGFYAKVKIPYVENLNNLGVTGGVLKSELIFYPLEGSFDNSIFRLPSSAISVYVTNRDNNRVMALTDSRGAALRAVYNNYTEHKNESYYSIDLTSYVNDILTNGQDYEDALLIGFPYESIGNTIDRLVIENDPDSNFRIRLKTTYVVQN
ncbi:DUF4270 family protein [Labilibaculum sp. 44]|uniref:DUF4270 family protein n=2 Tax=Labilibaculum euxinus TaxID=2686357 RepID=A0A7M4D157_9BACT|nr:DUF4270 family protein [Labilibaculum euxinus]MVB05591.1 DUF4270 family protein [Labilibaculum euxinus]